MNRSKPNPKSRRLGFSAGLLLNLFSRKSRPHSAKELYQKDFRPNTKKMGLRFTDRIRNAFRSRWLRLK